MRKMTIGIRRLTTAALAVFIVGAVAAEDFDLSAVTSLKVDLDQVVEFGTVAPVDGVTASGQPDEAALEIFADAGYVGVVDLRGPGEDRGFDEEAVIEELGMHYMALPIESKDAVTFENAQRLGDILDELDGPVLVHCGSGNRVGALFALRRSSEGADEEAAIAYGEAAGLTSLEETVRTRLAEGTP